MVSRRSEETVMRRFIPATLRCLTGYRAQLGETPVWCERSASLLWVDILAGKSLRYWPDSQRIEIREMPRFTSALLLSDTPEVFVAVSQSGIWRYDYTYHTYEPICAWPAAEQGMRPNEATVAPDGTLWFSTMDPAAQYSCGSWYRLAHPMAELQMMLGGQQVPNTLHWHDGYLWFADSLRQQIHCSTETPDGLDIQQSYQVAGIPDGSALTVDGILINARWGASSLALALLHQTQLQPCGELPLPVHQPSSCTFGGPDLSDLFITSAREGMIAPASADGALLIIKTRFTGKPACRFRL